MKNRIGSRIALATLLALGLMGPRQIAPYALAQSKGDPASGMLQYPVNFQINQEESKAFASMRKGEASVNDAEAKKVIAEEMIERLRPYDGLRVVIDDEPVYPWWLEEDSGEEKKQREGA